MNITAIVLLLCVVINSSTQIAEFEKQALASVQREPASSFDKELPGRSFGAWFNEVVGERAGVVWQLSECGDPAEGQDKSGEMPACAEVNAILANGSKVVVMILVGSFARGMKGEPSFFGSVIEYKDQFYRVNRLRDLPKMVRDPASNHPVELPGVTAKEALVKLHFQSLPPTETKALESSTDGDGNDAVPPPPRKVVEAVVQGWAVTKIKPKYPTAARKMNAYGPVEVRILISPEGKVIEAAAVSGHMALRAAAVAAARGWVFNPTTIDGVPVNTESVLTFVFARGGK
ncbi:MAG: TonB family protein [Blastocatellia bacterium]|nr:TonB family protein [Blastocatellia bacterium]